MKIDLFTATGQKKGTLDLPPIFESTINMPLIHQAVVMQQSNRRYPIAHARRRGEVAGSTKKVYQQKHTGRARRGAVRSPLLRGGGKSFGPRKEQNFHKSMPREMRRLALASALAAQAKRGGIMALEGYTNAVKTKDAVAMLKKMPLDLGRRILVVTASPMSALEKSVRNIPGIQTLTCSSLNTESVMVSRSIIFLTEALEQVQQMFGTKKVRPTGAARMKSGKRKVESGGNQKKETTEKKAIKKTLAKVNKKTTKTKAKKSSESSDSSESSAS